MATTARYSLDVFFEGLQFQAIDSYARTAWLDILTQAFSSDPSKGMDIFMVQATNMLAVIDYTGNIVPACSGKRPHADPHLAPQRVGTVLDGSRLDCQSDLHKD